MVFYLAGKNHQNFNIINFLLVIRYFKELNSFIFLGSSAVERSTVNRLVAGSNPARGVYKFQKVIQSHHKKGDFFYFFDFFCQIVVSRRYNQVNYIILRTVYRTFSIIKFYYFIYSYKIKISFLRTVTRTFIKFSTKVKNKLFDLFSFFKIKTYFRLYTLNYYTIQEILVIPHILFLLI